MMNPGFVSAQVDFGVSTTVSRSDEWMLSELTNSRIHVGQVKAGFSEPVTVTAFVESFGKPVVNRTIKFKFEHQANVTKEVIGVTNEGGVWETTVASNIPGSVRITGYDVSEGREYKLLDEEIIEIIRSDNRSEENAKIFLGTQSLSRQGWISQLVGWLERVFN